MKIESGSKFMSLAEVADDLGATRTTVRGWLDEAQIPAFCFGTGRNARLHYKREDVERWIEECGGPEDEDDVDDAVAAECPADEDADDDDEDDDDLEEEDDEDDEFDDVEEEDDDEDDEDGDVGACPNPDPDPVPVY